MAELVSILIPLMNKLIQTLMKKLDFSLIVNFDNKTSQKYEAEIAHWKRSFSDYQKWFTSEIDELYGEKPPAETDKVAIGPGEINAILTWQKIHQQTKYLEDLQLSENEFADMTLLDVGSGPHPSALAFKNCSLYCLDPLLPEYLKVGFPMHYYEDRVKFAYGYSEKMPFNDRFFDAVISVNAIDHVDDFQKTAKEIQRVLKPNGKIRMHIHYHKKTPTEPLELNDDVVAKAYEWCINFSKIHETKEKRGYKCAKDESYALWSNFP